MFPIAFMEQSNDRNYHWEINNDVISWMHLGSPITTYRLVTYIHVLIYLTKKRRSFMVLGKTLSLSLSLSLPSCFSLTQLSEPPPPILGLAMEELIFSLVFQVYKSKATTWSKEKSTVTLALVEPPLINNFIGGKSTEPYLDPL